MRIYTLFDIRLHFTPEKIGDRRVIISHVYVWIQSLFYVLRSILVYITSVNKSKRLGIIQNHHDYVRSPIFAGQSTKIYWNGCIATNNFHSLHQYIIHTLIFLIMIVSSTAILPIFIFFSIAATQCLIQQEFLTTNDRSILEIESDFGCIKCW